MPVFPTAYFPSIGYIQKLIHFGEIQIDLGEHYIKQTIRNRCEILTSNGVLKLSVPLVHDKTKKLGTQEIEIDYSQRWQSIHWRAITSAYASSPYFDDYALEIKTLIEQEDTFLYSKNQAILAKIIELLALPLKIHYSKSYVEEEPNDYRAYDFLQRESLSINYQQVFGYDQAFTDNLSSLDLLFNEGPMARTLLLNGRK